MHTSMHAVPSGLDQLKWRSIYLYKSMVAQHSNSGIELEFVLGNLAYPFWVVLISVLKELEPNILVVQIGPKLKQLG